LEGMSDQAYLELQTGAHRLRNTELTCDVSSDAQKDAADRATWRIRVAVAMAAFVVTSFPTQAMPLSGVTVCIGLILVLTGNPQVGDARGGLKEGAFDYLVKPQPVGALVEVARSAWARRQARPEEARCCKSERILTERPD
jgi:DNA-binding NarL/FixJ family response regulator